MIHSEDGPPTSLKRFIIMIIMKLFIFFYFNLRESWVVTIFNLLRKKKNTNKASFRNDIFYINTEQNPKTNPCSDRESLWLTGKHLILRLVRNWSTYTYYINGNSSELSARAISSSLLPLSNQYVWRNPSVSLSHIFAYLARFRIRSTFHTIF